MVEFALNFVIVRNRKHFKRQTKRKGCVSDIGPRPGAGTVHM